jgi:hypothetical protein
MYLLTVVISETNPSHKPTGYQRLQQLKNPSHKPTGYQRLQQLKNPSHTFASKIDSIVSY